MGFICKRKKVFILKQLVTIVDAEKEDIYQKGLLVANWAQI